MEVFSQLYWWLGHPCGGLWEVRGWHGCARFVGWMWGNWRALRGHLCCSSEKKKKKFPGFIQVHDKVRKKCPISRFSPDVKSYSFVDDCCGFGTEVSLFSLRQLGGLICDWLGCYVRQMLA